MTVKIVEAASDERGALAYGKKGDQKITGTPEQEEVRIRTLTESAGFTKILRYPDLDLRKAFAKDALEIARNQNVGYAQYGDPNDKYAGRYGLYYAMLDVKNFSEIKTPCNCDCSALVADVLIHNGINCPTTMRTATERNELARLGFEELPYTLDNCRLGDILWRNGHTAIIVRAPEQEEKGEDMAYNAVLTSSRDLKMWSTGAGVLTRECPYVSVSKSALGFTPNVIVVQQEGECLANTQWIRGQANLYCANYENNATAGIAVGTAKGYFNPDSIDIQIPVRFPSRKYIVKIYS